MSKHHQECLLIVFSYLILSVYNSDVCLKLQTIRCMLFSERKYLADKSFMLIPFK